ncbi:MAG: alpha/beta hydrolase [Bacteroidetes bacterium]|nr:MAG: alpha/beta hydrolase [Bacteroidota bacterium]
MNTNSFLLLLAACLLACGKPVTPTYERFMLRYEGADLAIQVDGNRASGVFILLLHGGPGGSGHEYNTGTYSELLEAQYAVVYLDQRGQGASQGHYSRDNITLQQFSDDIEAVARLLKQKYGSNISLFLMGHSWGGMTGTHSLLHTDVQNLLKGWIEVDGAHDVPMLNKAAIRMFIEIGSQQISMGKQVDRWKEIVEFARGVDTTRITNEQGGQINQYGFEAEGLIEEIYQDEGAVKLADFLFSPVAPFTGFVAGSLTSAVINQETEQTSLTPLLGEVRIPVLLLWGKYDFVVPPALAETAMQRLGTVDKKLLIFEHSGHSPMNSEPQAFAQEIIRFVEAHR